MLKELTSEVDRLSGETIELCYHCHKCTAGCPIVEEMEYGPDQVLRLVSLNELDLLLNSRDIWLCAGCYTCATRCPNDIDIAAVMDALRQIAIKERWPAVERDVLLFHRLFLGVVRTLGRSHEAAVLGLFKLLSRIPLKKDMDAGLALFLRGKVPLLPEAPRARGEIQRIFERSG